MSILEFEDKFSQQGEDDVGVQGKLKDNLLDVLKHGRTESTTARPWYPPTAMLTPGFISSKMPGFVYSIC